MTAGAAHSGRRGRDEVDGPGRFTVGSLIVEDGQLVLTGRWTGVRGMRFVRPTLVLPHRDVLATLTHKPWAVVDGADWVVAFPWSQDAPPPLDSAQLAVAPNITVPLGAAGVPPASPPVAERERTARLEREVDFLRGRRTEELGAARERLGATEDARDALRDRLAVAEARVAELEQRAAELTAARLDAERRAADAEARLAALDDRAGAEVTALRRRAAALEERLAAAGQRAAARPAPPAAPQDDDEDDEEPSRGIVAPSPARAPAPARRELLPGLDAWAQRVLATAAALSLLLLLLGIVRLL